MNRGFTIVEVLVVVTVLAILVTISAATFSQVYKNGNDSAAKSLADVVRAGAEKYYTTNSEYPLATAVHGAALTGSPPASYSTASSVLGVPFSTLTESKMKLVACGPTQATCKLNNLNTQYVYYFTKATQASTSAEVITTVAAGGDCAYTFPASETGALAYIIAFYNSVENQWKITRSNNGTVNTSHAFFCPFTTP